MTEFDEHLERLMNRSLDGALSEDEELEFNRELIRNPRAQKVLSDYRSNDALAAAALENLVEGPPVAMDWNAGRSVQPMSRRRRLAPLWMLVPGAIAAALLALVIPYPSAVHRNVSDPRSPVVSATMPTSPIARQVMHPARNAPAIHRDTGRDIIGVVGDDGNVYWIEVERTRTIKLPPRAPAGESNTL